MPSRIGMLIDLHVHTDFSACSTLDSRDILAHARNRGLDGVCLTDHDTMAVLSRLREGPQNDGLIVLVGMEYETPQGDFLIFGPFEKLSSGLAAEELLPLVASRGGAAVAAHPCRRGRPTNKRLVRPGLCSAVEILNGRNSEEENLRAETLNVRTPLTLTGGSDAHTLDELGRFATRFDHPIRNRRDLVSALLRGDCRPERNHHLFSSVDLFRDPAFA